ncbi:MAG: hypothetical protein IPG45_23860 [Deltaproteobacteria bacterium]|nr:hypothetical protein [Deltaproteobacteria bacterium]
MAGGIPSGLGALLSRLGLGGPTGHEVGVEAKGLKGKEAAGEKPGLEKGTVLGPDGQALAGLGYNHEDRQSALKNLTEQSNVSRFLDAVHEQHEAPRLFAEQKNETGETKGTKTELDAKELAKDGDTQLRKDETVEDKKAAAQLETKEQEQVKEKHETKEAEHEGRERQKDEREDEEKHGHGWVLEEHEEDTPEGKRTLRTGDTLGDHHRCHGTIEDGTRCLRKPTKGTPYCPEHGAVWQIRAKRIEQA